MIQPGEISVKDRKVLRGLIERRFQPLLINIIEWIAQEYGCVITESYRPKRNMNDLHGTQPVRAIDLRSWCYGDKLANEIKHEINRRWEYDFNRKFMEVALLHRVAGGALHFHIQVHPNTRRKKYT